MSIPKILTVIEDKVVVDEVVLGIPEFKVVWETYNNVSPFCYLWAMHDPESPYMNYPANQREEEVLKDFPPEDYHPQDLEMLDAIEKCKALYYSPLRKILDAAKSAVENISLYLTDAEITSGRDGNFTQVVGAIKSLPSIIKAYQEAEIAYKQEVQRNRADIKSAIDEDADDDYND
jgi:hypothetical protein